MLTNKEAIEILTNVIDGKHPSVRPNGYFHSAIQTAIQALKRVDKLEEMEKTFTKDLRTTE